MKKSFNLSVIALNNQAMVRFLMVMFFIIGTFAYFHLNQKEDPDFNFRTMVVSVFWPGATAMQVEQQITERLEQYLNEVPHAQTLYGYSKPGEAEFYIDLDEGLSKQEIEDAWYQVRKKVADIKHLLPEEILGPYFNDEFGDVFGSVYAIVPDGYNYADIKLKAEDIRRELLRLPDVGKVLIIGDQTQKIYIEFSPAKMATLGIDPSLIADTIRNQNAMQPAGMIRTPNKEIIMRISGAFDSLESIRDTNIHSTTGDFRLGDVANVYRGYVDPPSFKMHYQGKEAVGLIISMKQNRDVLKMGASLDNELNMIKASLPRGIDIYQVSNQPQVVEHAVHGFVHSLFEAIVIVLLVSFFTLGFRSGAVVALSIPLVLAITFTIMYLFNMDLQRVSLGALIIAIGLLVDDAMITVEMMLRKLEEGFNAAEAATFAYTSTAFPMLTGTLITIAGFLPIGMAQSDTGKYTFSILSVVGISLMVSWIVAVFFTPYIGYKILKEHKESTHNEHNKPLNKFVHQVVQWCVDNCKLVVLITVVTFILSVFCFRFVNKQFFPPSDRPEILVNMQLPEGSHYYATEREVNKLEKILSSDKNIVNYTTYIGGNTPRFYLPLLLEQNRVNFAQMVIMTKGGDAREAVLNKLNTLFEQDFPMVTPQISRLENGPPVGYPIQFRISGKNADVLYDIAAQVTAIVKKNPNTSGVNNDWGKTFNQVLILDNDKARALGISGKDLGVSLYTILSGYSIAKYREKTELIDIEARGDPSVRSNIDSLKDINIYSTSGIYIPLDHIVHFENKVEENKIWRRDGALTITVNANVIGSVEPLDVSHQLYKEMTSIQEKLPAGYQIKNEGVAKSSAVAEHSIAAVLPVALFIMMLLLMIQLDSFQLVIIVFLTAPLGIIGVTFTLLLFHLPFGFVATLGIIALMGMIMRNSVILIDQIEKNIKAKINPYDAIIKATVERFRPIMLTALAAILAMIPLLPSIFWGSMAATIMGGLFAATLLTILFLPALYAAWFKIKKSPEQ
jgi:multidrug efflux pump